MGGGEVSSNYRGIQPIVTRFPSKDRIQLSEADPNARGELKRKKRERERKSEEGERMRGGQWRKRRRATVRRAKETIPSRNGDSQKPSTENQLNGRDGEQRKGNKGKKARTEKQIKRSPSLERERMQHILSHEPRARIRLRKLFRNLDDAKRKRDLGRNNYWTQPRKIFTIMRFQGEEKRWNSRMQPVARRETRLIE